MFLMFMSVSRSDNANDNPAIITGCLRNFPIIVYQNVLVTSTMEIQSDQPMIFFKPPSRFYGYI